MILGFLYILERKLVLHQFHITIYLYTTIFVKVSNWCGMQNQTSRSLWPLWPLWQVNVTSCPITFNFTRPFCYYRYLMTSYLCMIFAPTWLATVTCWLITFNLTCTMTFTPAIYINVTFWPLTLASTWQFKVTAWPSLTSRRSPPSLTSPVTSSLNNKKM